MYLTLFPTKGVSSANNVIMKLLERHFAIRSGPNVTAEQKTEKPGLFLFNDEVNADGGEFRVSGWKICWVSFGFWL